ncbi:hypothetical protein [Salinispora arenicola]|uniref:hypothetical protein n=1 Tax=Salinispora arenicola TaxID=168697 RepID=UPI0003623229|nr:hypothetical protein [Salinispora arenicola]
MDTPAPTGLQPQTLTAGTRVRYEGSLPDFHGEYVVQGRCYCRQECLDNSFAPLRYELAEAPGWSPVLLHVSPKSVRVL